MQAHALSGASLIPYLSLGLTSTITVLYESTHEYLDIEFHSQQDDQNTLELLFYVVWISHVHEPFAMPCFEVHPAK